MATIMPANLPDTLLVPSVLPPRFKQLCLFPVFMVDDSLDISIDGR